MISAPLFSSVLPDPYPGELLSSVLVRAAHRRGESPTRLASGHWPEANIWDRDIDRFASDDVIARLADVGGQPAERLSAAMLRREAVAFGGPRVAASGGGAAATAPMIMSLGVRQFRWRRHGLAFCPLCLAERPGVYQKMWRLGFVMVCPVHAVRLRDACPQCDAPVEPHRNLSLRTDRCATCATPLAVAQSIPAEPEYLAFQLGLSAELDHAATHISCEVGGNGCKQSTPKLERVRTLCAVASHRAVAPRIAGALGVGFDTDGSGHFRLEFMRIRDREALLGIVAAWTEDWPSRFVAGAAAASLTQRSFARLHLSPDLEAVVRLLPARSRNHTDHGPPVHDREARRLRRRRARGYAALRADRVLAAIKCRS